MRPQPLEQLQWPRGLLKLPLRAGALKESFASHATQTFDSFCALSALSHQVSRKSCCLKTPRLRCPILPTPLKTLRSPKQNVQILHYALGTQNLSPEHPGHSANKSGVPTNGDPNISTLESSRVVVYRKLQSAIVRGP